MDIIETTAPINIDELKKYFINKNTTYIIDYEKSELQGEKLLTYLSNLDIPCDITNYGDDFLVNYLHTKNIVNISSLENDIINILLEKKELVEGQHKDFIKDNIDILNQWEKVLESCSLYNVYTINNEDIRKDVESYPLNDTDTRNGINFISLLKHEHFYTFYSKINNRLEYYKHYFNDYMFKGENLYKYWGNNNNPMFLLTYAISTGKREEYMNLRKEEIENVSSI